MTKYEEARVKLTNTQINKLKSAAKNKTGIILRINKEKFEDEELSHELFLKTRQTTEIRDAFRNNVPTDIKLSKAQMSKTIQPGGSFGFGLGNLGKKALTNVAIPLVLDNLPRLESNLTSNAINKFKIKMWKWKRSCESRKEFPLFIPNEDMNDIVEIIKSLEDLGVLIDRVTETVKHEIQKQEGGFLRIF